MLKSLDGFYKKTPGQMIRKGRRDLRKLAFRNRRRKLTWLH